MLKAEEQQKNKLVSLEIKKVNAIKPKILKLIE